MIGEILTIECSEGMNMILRAEILDQEDLEVQK